MRPWARWTAKTTRVAVGIAAAGGGLSGIAFAGTSGDGTPDAAAVLGGSELLAPVSTTVDSPFLPDRSASARPGPLAPAWAVLAWSFLMIIVVAAGMSRSHPVQADVRIASGTPGFSLAGRVSVAAVSVMAVSPAARYVVQPGDTLSGIAARLAVRGGWQGLYAANRSLIGPDPAVIHPGTVLVLPGGHALARYVVAPGDTLTAIAAGLALPGGWQRLYEANGRVIGADPDVIRPGTVLVLPRPTARYPSARGPGRRPASRPRPSPVSGGHHPEPTRPPTAVMPSWLTGLLLAAGLLIAVAFAAEPVLAVRRRRAAVRAAQTAAPRAAPAGYDRLVVTHSVPAPQGCRAVSPQATLPGAIAPRRHHVH